MISPERFLNFRGTGAFRKKSKSSEKKELFLNDLCVTCETKSPPHMLLTIEKLGSGMITINQSGAFAGDWLFEDISCRIEGMLQIVDINKKMECRGMFNLQFGSDDVVVSGFFDATKTDPPTCMN